METTQESPLRKEINLTIRRILTILSGLCDISVDASPYPGTFSLFPNTMFAHTFHISEIFNIELMKEDKIHLLFTNGDYLYLDLRKNGITYQMNDLSPYNMLRRIKLAICYVGYKFTY